MNVCNKYIKAGIIIFVLCCLSQNSFAQFKIARLKYDGGGDWYNDPSAITNLIRFTQNHVAISIDKQFDDISISSTKIHLYPFLFLTGHGSIVVSNAELNNLRQYLNNGGFLYIDDDYGLDKAVRTLTQKLYPNHELVELPFNHPIFHQVFDFPDGLPKVHEHDKKPPQCFALFLEGRIAILYTHESNLADGWTDKDIHNTPDIVHQNALQMGTNILVYALTHF